MKNSSEAPAHSSGLDHETVEWAKQYPRGVTVILNMYGAGIAKNVADATAELAAEKDPIRRDQLEQSIDRYRKMHLRGLRCQPEQRDALRAIAEEALANEEKTER